MQSSFFRKTTFLIKSVLGPWEKDPHYFKDIQISALALLKMVMHARSGGSLEIMGLLLGKVVENTMVRFTFFAQTINVSNFLIFSIFSF